MRVFRESVASLRSPRAVILGLALAAAALVAVPVQISNAQTTTLKPLTFTETQANRGKAAFGNNSCAACHGSKLEGLDGGPTLLGENIKETQFSGSVADLYNFLLEFMPASDPGTLKPADAAAIVAFLAQQNGFKPGDVDLPSDPAAMAEMGFTQ